MFQSFVSIVLLLLLESNGIDSILVGSITNVSLLFRNSSLLLINATCEECLCQLYSNPNFTSFNYYANNQSCRMHQKSDQNQSFPLMPSSVTTLYFLSLPNVQAAPDWIEYLWTFDSSFNDQSSTMNFTSVNRAGYSSSTITGYGASLTLNASRSQYLWMGDPFLNLVNTSWTFELWIYLRSISNTSDTALIEQCQSQSLDQCLHLIIRSQQVYFGFFADDAVGVQTLVSLRWYHLALVFDCTTRNQSIYIDGFLDNSHQASGCYQGNRGNLTIGFPQFQTVAGMNYYDGLIDQLSCVIPSKTADEILRDATLTVYFPFDNNSTDDGGPLGINGTRSGSTNFTVGRIGDALQINNVPDSYFRVSGLVLLGTADQAYSLAIWVRPSQLQNSTIIHVSSDSTGQVWCVPMLTLTNNGQLRAMSWSGSSVTIMGSTISANQWTHAAVTYSINNGLRFYINGTLRNSSLPFSYHASGTANYLFLGSSLNGTTCGRAPIYNGQYAGGVDELYVYSSELSSGEVVNLANP